MRKIIQFLRLSRLILLVILLLIAVAAKIARAETALMYYVYQRQALGYFATPQAACSASDKPMFRPVQNDSPINSTAGYCRKDEREPSYVHYTVMKSSKTCDPKELTHNGSGAFYDGENSEYLKPFFWLQSPSGIDAKDWFSDRFTSCENNCIVRNTRSEFHPKSVTEADGTSWSAFRKRQTGEVCVVEKQKPDVIPKPPAPDTDNGTGNGQSNPGSDSGNAQDQGSSGSNGSGSESGIGSDNQGSGNSDGGGSSSGGSGSGSGGVNGSGGQTGPSGGGTSGGESGGDQAEGSEGGTGDGQSGSGQSGGGSGEGGGQGGTDSGGQGSVGNGQSGDGDGEAGGHYFPCPSGKGSYKKGTEPSAECKGDGKGEGDGKGSVEGGNCETGQAPVCKGDPVQCYIAKEQWRTACAATGQSNNIEFEGNCENNTSPKCKGDAVQCYMAKQQWQQGCAAAAAQGAIVELSQYGESQQGYLDELAREGNPDNIFDAIKPDTIDLTGKLNTGLVKLPNACPTFPVIDMGIYGKYDIPTDQLCDVLRTLGRILLGISYIFSFYIIVRAM